VKKGVHADYNTIRGTNPIEPGRIISRKRDRREDGPHKPNTESSLRAPSVRHKFVYTGKTSLESYDCRCLTCSRGGWTRPMCTCGQYSLSDSRSESCASEILTRIESNDCNDTKNKTHSSSCSWSVWHETEHAAHIPRASGHVVHK